MNTKHKGGFSLIEVNLAILIAALGLMMLFQLFPIGLRQSVQSESDLRQTTFANALFEEINANIRGHIVEILPPRKPILDDVVKWNNPDEFWKVAIKDLGFPASFQNIVNFSQLQAESVNLKADLLNTGRNAGPNPDLYFAVREGVDHIDNGRILIPPQVIVRVRVVQNNNGRSPNSYIVSVASTDAPYPAFLHNRQVYNREYYYQRRP